MPGTNSPAHFYSEQINARRDEIATRYPTLSEAEATLLAAFRAATDDARGDMLPMMLAIAKHEPRQRPTLTLVKGHHGKNGEAA